MTNYPPEIPWHEMPIRMKEWTLCGETVIKNKGVVAVLQLPNFPKALTPVLDALCKVRYEYVDGDTYLRIDSAMDNSYGVGKHCSFCPAAKACAVHDHEMAARYSRTKTRDPVP